MLDNNIDFDLARESVLLGFKIRSFFLDVNVYDPSKIIEVRTIIKSLEEQREKEGEQFRPFTHIYYLFFKVIHIEIERIKHALDGDAKLVIDKKVLSDTIFSNFRQYLNEYFGHFLGNNSLTLIRNKSQINRVLVLEIMRKLPFPISYFNARKRTNFFACHGTLEKNITKKEKTVTSLIRINIEIDNTPLVSKKILQPKIMYSLKIRLKIIGWSKKFSNLKFIFITTCPKEQYSISNFEISRPDISDKDTFESDINGEIKFDSSQSAESENISFTIQPIFIDDSNETQIKTIGTNQIYFKILERNRSSLESGYGHLDDHVESLLGSLSKNKKFNNELENLRPILSAVTKLAGTFAQMAIFKNTTTMSEIDFQREVLTFLKIIFGEEMQEHTGQAGGLTDIKYKNVIIELKVERGNGNREYICRKHKEQVTQYQGVEARQVAILLVLDLTEKKHPPGDLRNDICLIDVTTHGGPDSRKEFPSKVIAFIINGNIKNPSNYS